MSEINGSDTYKVLGARVSRKIVPWVIGFAILLVSFGMFFWSKSSGDFASVAKEKKEAMITQAEKNSESGNEADAKRFIKEKEDEIKRKEFEKQEKEKEEKAKKVDPVDSAMSGTDVIKFDKLHKARIAAMNPDDMPLPSNKEGVRRADTPNYGSSDMGNARNTGGSSREFYEDYGQGVNVGQFVPGSNLRNSQATAEQTAIQKHIETLTKQQEQAQAAQRRSPPAVNQDPNAAWQKEMDAKINETSDLVYPTRVGNRFVLYEGTVIPCVLEGEINSELPGRVNCRTSMDVYDGIFGINLLIPKGSRIMGEYNSTAKDGQDRVMIAFSRIFLANGRSIKLPLLGADEMGRSGVEADVDNRFWRMFGPSFLVAGIARIFQPNTNITVNAQGASSSMIDATGQILSDISKKIITRYEAAGPILRIEKGTKMNVVVSRDMAIPPDGGVAWDAAGMLNKGR